MWLRAAVADPHRAVKLWALDIDLMRCPTQTSCVTRRKFLDLSVPLSVSIHKMGTRKRVSWACEEDHASGYK